MLFTSFKRGGRPSALLASVAAVATLGAGLIAPSALAAGTGDLNASDVTFTWGVNNESGGGAYFGGCNFLSAGEAGDNGQAGIWANDNTFYSTKSGNVEVLKPTADGTLAEPTWKTKCTNQYGTNINGITAGLTFTPADSRKDPNAPAGAPAVQPTYSGNVVRISGGTGTVNPDTDSAHLEWQGSFTIVYYGGMTYWSLSNPVLDVKNGKGTITATASGYGADMDDASKWLKLESKEIHLADLQNTTVDVTDSGITVTPDYLGVTVPDDVSGRNDQAEKTDENAAWWGAFPGSWLKYATLTGQTSYWWTSSGGEKTIQPRKPASPITITYTAEAPGPDPTKVGVTGQISAEPTVIDPTKDQQITVKGTGFTGDAAAFGAYVVIADKSVWEPGKTPTDQSAFPIQKWVRPANDPKDGYANLDENGNWTQVLDIPANTLDPSKQYVVGTFAAHMLSVTNRNLDHAVDLTLQIPATAPDAPAKPTATATSASSVKVEWTAPDDGGSAITGYTVTLTPSKGDPITQNAAADATSVTFDKLTAQGVSYTAIVVATNAQGASAASPASDPVTPNADPAADLAVSVTPVSDIDPAQSTTFTVKGTGFTGGAAAYGAYVVVADTAQWNKGQTPTGDLKQFVSATWVKPADIKDGAFTATVTVDANKLEYGKTYVVGTMAAHQLSLTDRRLDTATAIALKAQPQAPEAPAQPTATANGTSVTVAWTAPADGGSAITGYTVTLTPEGGKGEVKTQKVDASQTTATFDGLAKGVTYTAAVSATNAQGDSAQSAPSAPVTVPATAPAAVTDVKLAAGGVHELVAGWTAPADDGGSAIVAYDVTLTSTDGSFTKTVTVDAPTTAATFADLDPALQYTAVVVAKNAIGASAPSAASAAASPTAIAPKLSFADADKNAIDALTLAVGDTTTVNVLAQGEHVGGQPVTWESSDPDVVSFLKKAADDPQTAAVGYDEQTVVALKAGTATITVKATIDGTDVSATLPVTVTAPSNGGDQGGNGSDGDTDGGDTDGDASGDAPTTGQQQGTTGTDDSANGADSTDTKTVTNNAAASDKPATLSKTGSAVTGIALASLMALALGAGAVAVRRLRER